VRTLGLLLLPLQCQVSFSRSVSVCAASTSNVLVDASTVEEPASGSHVLYAHAYCTRLNHSYSYSTLHTYSLVHSAILLFCCSNTYAHGFSNTCALNLPLPPWNALRSTAVPP